MYRRKRLKKMFGEFKDYSEVKKSVREMYQSDFYPHLEREGRNGLKVRVGYYAPELERDERNDDDDAKYHTIETAIQALRGLELDLKNIQYFIREARKESANVKGRKWRKVQRQNYLWIEYLHGRYRSHKYGIARMRKAIQKQI